MLQLLDFLIVLTRNTLLFDSFLVIVLKQFFVTFYQFFFALFQLLDQSLALFVQLLLLFTQFQNYIIRIPVVLLHFQAFFLRPFKRILKVNQLQLLFPNLKIELSISTYLIHPKFLVLLINSLLLLFYFLLTPHQLFHQYFHLFVLLFMSFFAMFLYYFIFGFSLQ